MANLGLIGLALGNAQAGLDAYNQGAEGARELIAKRNRDREKSMELALKDSALEDTRRKMRLELLASMPMRNEPMIRDYATELVEPLTKIKPPEFLPGDAGLAARIQGYADEAKNPVRLPGIDTTGIGTGARDMWDSYNRPSPKAEESAKNPVSKQGQAIERLRDLPLTKQERDLLGRQQSLDNAIGRLKGTPQRSPQSVGDSLYLERGDREIPGTRTRNWEFQLGQAPAGAQVQTEDPNVITASPLEYAQEPSIVQPLEGGSYIPSPLSAATSEIGVEPLEVETHRDPRLESAIRDRRHMRESPYAWLLDDARFAKEFDDGYYRSGGFQTTATLDALKALDQTRFMSLKSAADIQQRGYQTEINSELKRYTNELSNATRMMDIIRQRGDTEARLYMQNQIKHIEAMIAINRLRHPPPGRSKSAKDVYEADYIKQLQEARTEFSRAQYELPKNFGPITPEALESLTQTNPTTWGPIKDKMRALWEVGDNYPRARQNNAPVFEAFGYGAPAPGSKPAPVKKVPATGASGGPVKGQQRRLSDGSVATFDGKVWK